MQSHENMHFQITCSICDFVFIFCVDSLDHEKVSSHIQALVQKYIKQMSDLYIYTDLR